MPAETSPENVMAPLHLYTGINPIPRGVVYGLNVSCELEGQYFWGRGVGGEISTTNNSEPPMVR